MPASTSLKLVVAALLPVAVFWRADDDAVKKEESARRLAAMKKTVDAFEITVGKNGADRLARVDEPIQRWSNPIVRIVDATVFLWTRDRRPVAVAQVAEVSGDGVWQEIQSLTTEPLQGKRDGQSYWAPTAAGIKWLRAPTTEVPAGTPELRRIQMRKIADTALPVLRAAGWSARRSVVLICARDRSGSVVADRSSEARGCRDLDGGVRSNDGFRVPGDVGRQRGLVMPGFAFSVSARRHVFLNSSGSKGWWQMMTLKKSRGMSNVRWMPSAHVIQRLSLVIVLSGLLGGLTAADDEEDSQALKRKDRTEKLLKFSRTFSENTRVAVLANGKEQVGELKAEPVMRYSDEPRFISDATLWVWSLNSRPVAIQKVEVNDLVAVPLWTICFGSFAESNVEVTWPSGHTFKSKERGWVFEPNPDADAPAERVAARSLQMRALSRRFSGDVFPVTQKSKVEMRLLPKPLYEYSDPETKLPIGAIFSLASNGTNPTIFLAIEARRDREGRLGWYHAHTRMTSDTGAFRLDDKSIWEFKEVKHENWIHFFLRREIDFKE